MAKVLYIPCDIYKRGINIFVGTLNELKSWVRKDYTDNSEQDFVNMVMGLEEQNIGMASFNYNNMDGQGVVLIPKFPETPEEYASLVHELLHATFHVLNFCHVEYAYDGTNEAFTYLLEHLTRCALEKDNYSEVKED